MLLSILTRIGKLRKVYIPRPRDLASERLPEKTSVLLGPRDGSLKGFEKRGAPRKRGQSDPTGQELLMRNCSQIPAAAWQQLEGAQWPKLTKVDFEGCLGFWAPVEMLV